MCSAKPASEDGSDDVWGDDSDKEGSVGELQRERTTRQQQFFNSGYRDGLEAGKEKTLQDGFNIGFGQGMQAGYEWGCLKAAVKTLRIACGQLPGSSQWESKVNGMSARLEGVRDRQAMLWSMQQLLAVPLSADDLPQAAHGNEELMAALSTAMQQTRDGVEIPELPAGSLTLPPVAEIIQTVQADLTSLGFAELAHA